MNSCSEAEGPGQSGSTSRRGRNIRTARELELQQSPGETRADTDLYNNLTSGNARSHSFQTDTEGWEASATEDASLAEGHRRDYRDPKDVSHGQMPEGGQESTWNVKEEIHSAITEQYSGHVQNKKRNAYENERRSSDAEEMQGADQDDMWNEVQGGDADDFLDNAAEMQDVGHRKMMNVGQRDMQNEVQGRVTDVPVDEMRSSSQDEMRSVYANEEREEMQSLGQIEMPNYGQGDMQDEVQRIMETDGMDELQNNGQEMRNVYANENQDLSTREMLSVGHVEMLDIGQGEMQDVDLSEMQNIDQGDVWVIDQGEYDHAGGDQRFEENGAVGGYTNVTLREEQDAHHHDDGENGLQDLVTEWFPSEGGPLQEQGEINTMQEAGERMDTCCACYRRQPDNRIYWRDCGHFVCCDVCAVFQPTCPCT